MNTKISGVTSDGYFLTFEMYPVNGLDPYECIFNLNQDKDYYRRIRIFEHNKEI